MNRYLMRKTEPSSRSRLYKIFAGLFLLTAANQSLAKIGTTNERVARQVKNPVFGSKKINPTLSKNLSTYSLKNVIRGRVVDSLENYPLPGVTIILEDTKLGTHTDKEGKFELIIPVHLLKKKNIFMTYYVGMKSKKFSVSATEFPFYKEIFLFEDPAVLQGEVVVTSYRERK